MPEVEEPDLQTVADLFEGRYVIEQRLPWNGLALVFQARREADPVAVAVLPIDCESAPERAERFAELVASSESLAHPRIVPVRGHGVRHGVPWVEMELADGRILGEELAEGPMAPERAFAIARQILDALGHAHALGVVHLDLTPANVLVEREPSGRDRVRVIGFGLAQVVRRARDTDRTGPTGKGSGPSAPRYLAPELLVGNPPSARSDLYSVGALLHHMLVGEPPSSKSPAPPEHARAVLAFSLAHDPADRFDSAAAMALALEDWLRELAERESARLLEATGPTPVVDVAASDASTDARVPAMDVRVPAAAPAALPESLPPAEPTPAPRGRLPFIAALALLLAVGGGLAAWTMREDRPAATEPPAPSPSATSPSPPPAEPAETSATALPPSPLDGELPAPLAELLGRIEAGEQLSRQDLRPVSDWARDHRDDARPQLLIARAYTSMGWNTDAVERYEAAWRTDEDARHDPRMLEDLVRITMRPESGPAAERVIRLIYGSNALPVIDRLLEGGELRRDELERLQLVRARLAR